MHNIDNNANIDMTVFTTWKQKNQVKKFTPSGNRTIGLGFQVEH